MVNDAFAAITITQIATYFILYKNKTRWIRMIGAALIILIGIATAVIGDTIPMMIFFLTSLLIGTIKLIEEVTELIK